MQHEGAPSLSRFVRQSGDFDFLSIKNNQQFESIPHHTSHLFASALTIAASPLQFHAL
jgi:hypothetical protein